MTRFVMHRESDVSERCNLVTVCAVQVRPGSTGVRAVATNGSMRDDGVPRRSPDATPVVEDATRHAPETGIPAPASLACRTDPSDDAGRVVRIPLHTRTTPDVATDDDPETLSQVPASRRAIRVERPGSLDEPALGCARTRGRDTRSAPGRLRPPTVGTWPGIRTGACTSACEPKSSHVPPHCACL